MALSYELCCKLFDKNFENLNYTKEELFFIRNAILNVVSYGYIRWRYNRKTFERERNYHTSKCDKICKR